MPTSQAFPGPEGAHLRQVGGLRQAPGSGGVFGGVFRDPRDAQAGQHVVGKAAPGLR